MSTHYFVGCSQCKEFIQLGVRTHGVRFWTDVGEEVPGWRAGEFIQRHTGHWAGDEDTHDGGKLVVFPEDDLREDEWTYLGDD